MIRAKKRKESRKTGTMKRPKEETKEAGRQPVGTIPCRHSEHDKSGEQKKKVSRCVILLHARNKK